VTSCFWMAPKEDCHSCTDGFTIRNLFPKAQSHLACHENKTAREKQQQTPVPTARSETSDPRVTAALAASSAASLPGRTQSSGTHQTTTDCVEVRRVDTWSSF
jgi:hypothetical protein